MGLSPAQQNAIIIIERISSVLSLLGASVVILTFSLNGKFRKSINRLVFYASLGNVATNIATMISVDGIKAGRGSALCQFQGLFIQWFIAADALWIFAMACNVWLAFFRSYDASALRGLELKYFIACYGIPFIPAFVYAFVRTSDRGSIYGSAELWCWVASEWDVLRIATFYGPAWVIIALTFAIYIQVGISVFKWRRGLLSTNKNQHTVDKVGLPLTGASKSKTTTITIEKTNASNIHATTQASASHDTSLGNIDPNKATLNYCKCSLLFFIALTITWIPSTINRVYLFNRPDDVAFGLNAAAGFVLPLQGFWNAIIYLSTSPAAVRSLWDDICDKYNQGRRDYDSLRTKSSRLNSYPTPPDKPERSSECELIRHC